jgi:2OG-Fe(II) oxygenase superfamily
MSALAKPMPAAQIESSMAGRKLELAAERSFIGAWYLDNLAVCDDLIQLFHASPNKSAGVITNRQGELEVRADAKESIDLALPPNAPEPALRRYIAELQKVVVKYVAEYPWCNEFAAWTVIEPVGIVLFPKGGGYKKFHTERVSAALPNAARHLVFMTYLNDVFDAGGTEFLHQKLIVAPRKGLTLIWPADWTHTHRGVVSPSAEKYIISGWFNFVPGNLVLTR